MLWAVSPARTLQDALAAELLQGHLAGGYQLRNPPLYEWLLWTVQQLVGPGPLSYLMLRYGLIASIGILFTLALLRTVASARLAAAFSLSLLLFFWFGWEIHHSVSHTLALLAAPLALFIAALAYAERPTAGLCASPRPHRRHRPHGQMELPARGPEPRDRACRDAGEPRTLLVLAGAALPILPFALWLATIDPGLVGRRTVPSGRALSLDQALQGVAALVTGIPLVFLPWIAFVLFFAWRFPKKPPSPPTPSHAVAIRLASLTAIVTLGLMAALLLAAFATGGALFGVSGFAIHCLFPFSLFAALALAGLIAQRVEEHRFAQRLAIISFGLALVIFLVKLASFYVVPGRSEANNLLSYARPRHGVIRDAVAARCRQSGYLFA
jgi:hypothetical protein